MKRKTTSEKSGVDCAVLGANPRKIRLGSSESLTLPLAGGMGTPESATPVGSCSTPLAPGDVSQTCPCSACSIAVQ